MSVIGRMGSVSKTTKASSWGVHIIMFCCVVIRTRMVTALSALGLNIVFAHTRPVGCMHLWTRRFLRLDVRTSGELCIEDAGQGQHSDGLLLSQPSGKPSGA